MNESRARFVNVARACSRRIRPRRERVLDRLTDLLLDTDEILAMVTAERGDALLWIEPHVRRVFDEIDIVVRRLCN